MGCHVCLPGALLKGSVCVNCGSHPNVTSIARRGNRGSEQWSCALAGDSEVRIGRRGSGSRSTPLNASPCLLFMKELSSARGRAEETALVVPTELVRDCPSAFTIACFSPVRPSWVNKGSQEEKRPGGTHPRTSSSLQCPAGPGGRGDTEHSVLCWPEWEHTWGGAPGQREAQAKWASYSFKEGSSKEFLRLQEQGGTRKRQNGSSDTRQALGGQAGLCPRVRCPGQGCPAFLGRVEILFLRV